MLQKLVPAEATESICHVDLDALRERGIKTILLDLDNTITPWRSLDVPGVSNTSKMKRLGILRDQLGVEGLGFVSKPWGMRRALRKLDVAPEEAVAIGDQLLTDVLGGNMAGCHTILVRPVSDDEFFGTKFVRFVERLCFGWLRRRRLFDKPWE